MTSRRPFLSEALARDAIAESLAIAAELVFTLETLLDLAAAKVRGMPVKWP